MAVGAPQSFVLSDDMRPSRGRACRELCEACLNDIKPGSARVLVGTPLEQGVHRGSLQPLTSTTPTSGYLNRTRSIVQLIEAERDDVVEVGTRSTTRVPHRLRGAAAGRSRSQPVRSAGKTLVLASNSGWERAVPVEPVRPVTPEVAGSSPVAPALRVGELRRRSYALRATVLARCTEKYPRGTR